MTDRATNARAVVVDDQMRARANEGWDADEVHWRDRLWNAERWALEARWPRGLRVRITNGGLAGVCGTVDSNRVYASDAGAWVRLDDGDVGLVHWSHLEPVESLTDA